LKQNAIDEGSGSLKGEVRSLKRAMLTQLFTLHRSCFELPSVYSESAVDRVRFLFRFLPRGFSHLFPKRAAVVPVEPDELVLSRIERHQLAFWPPCVNERLWKFEE